MKTISTVILCLVALFTKAQDFNPVPKPALNHKFGLGIDPLTAKIGARGEIGRILIALDFASVYVRVVHANVYFYDVKAFYVLQKKPMHRFYSGGGIEFIHTYFGGKDSWTLDGYLAIVPLGIEIFPSVQAPNFAIGLEGQCFALTDWSANLKIFYYLK